MKKILISLGYIFSTLVILGAVGLTFIVLFKPSFLEHVVHWMIGFVAYVGRKNYILAAIVTGMESIPFLNIAIPGQIFMIVIAGFVAQFDYMGILVVVAGATLLGDLFAYWLGTYKGESILYWYGPAFGLTPERVKKIHTLMEKHSHRAIFASKRNNYTRGIIPFIAGSAKAPFASFMLYNIIGSIVYSIVLVTLAKVFVGHYKMVLPYMRWIGIGLVCLAAVWYFLKRRRHAGKIG